MGAREVLSTIRNWMAGLRRAVLVNTLKSHALFALAALVSVTLLVLVLGIARTFRRRRARGAVCDWGVSAVAALGLGVVWPILKYTAFAPTDQKLAGDYAQRMPGIRDRVLNALQLLDKVENADRDGCFAGIDFSGGARCGRRTCADCSGDAAGQNVCQEERALRAVYFGGGDCAVDCVRRAIDVGCRTGDESGKDFSPSPEFVLHVAPGDVELVRGDSLKVIVTATGTLPKELTITRKEKGRTADSPLTVEGDEHGQYTVTWSGLRRRLTIGHTRRMWFRKNTRRRFRNYRRCDICR
jgi:hypothetical protein